MKVTEHLIGYQNVQQSQIIWGSMQFYKQNHNFQLSSNNECFPHHSAKVAPSIPTPSVLPQFQFYLISLSSSPLSHTLPNPLTPSQTFPSPSPIPIPQPLIHSTHPHSSNILNKYIHTYMNKAKKRRKQKKKQMGSIVYCLGSVS